MRITLGCSAEVQATIDTEAKRAGMSRGKYLSQVVQQIFEAPTVLTEGTHLDELHASNQLLSDEVVTQIPALARRARRNIDQMLLHLVEVGMEATQRSAASLAPVTKPKLRLVKPEVESA